MSSARNAYMRHSRYYEALLRQADAMCFEGRASIKRGLGLFEGEFGNIRAGQAWAVAHAEEDTAITKLCDDYPDAGVYCLSLRLHPRERIQWLVPAIDAARRLNDQDGLMVHLNSLGLG